MIVGITGGMGCGKSTAARFFERRGFRLLDSDRLVRESVLTAPEVVAAVRARWGESVFSAAGTVDRGRLGERVFADEAERRWLEELTHPVVFTLWRAALATDPKGHWVIEVPLLFERSLENWFDFTVTVTCSPDQQIVRLEQRGLSRSLAGQRLSAQLPLARKIELADFVLWNDGSAEFLEAQITRLTDTLFAGN